MAPQTLTIAQARRIALAAQGFTDPRPTGQPDIRHLRRVLGRISLLQMDSVNVLMRAHYLPLFSRLGAYPVALLDRAAYQHPRELFEYWAHEASLVPVSLAPLLRWRMARAHLDAWGPIRRIAVEQPDLVAWVLAEIRDKGPLTAAEIERDVPKRADNWGWNWSDTKRALEWLFWSGEVTATRRNTAFARVYDLPERALPAPAFHAPTPEPQDARRELVRLASVALGVAAGAELRDYFRLPAAGFDQALRELVEAGDLTEVRVQGWRGSAYLHRDAKLPRSVNASTVISPFDPLVWERSRTERLFGFRYRIEIYVPANQRVHGYYVLPFLHNEQLAARVDLKADRTAGVLRVPAAWHEPSAEPGPTAEALAQHLRSLADWLGLGEVAAPDRGDLAPALSSALAVVSSAVAVRPRRASSVYGDGVHSERQGP